MIDWIVNVWDWVIERFEDIHEINCSIPTVGALFEEYPIIAYLIVFAAIGLFVWFKFFNGANIYLNYFRG